MRQDPTPDERRMSSPSDPTDRSIGLYIHIPFCATKCLYCDFNTYAGIERLIPEYTVALANEIELWGETLGRPRAGTVFFGGGTPSYLSETHIGRLIDVIRNSFKVVLQAEVTLEANPDDVNGPKLDAWLGREVNRLSIGVQSFDDRLLEMLGRRHSSADAVKAHRAAVDAGFLNTNIDLMYGLPGQSMEDWRRTLEQANILAPPHVSMYCLTLEGGTPMERLVRSGCLAEPDPDLAADMYLMAEELMEREGYMHYEISNWSKPGFESRHNLVYWRNQNYLGIGPGAHSYLPGFRFFNFRSPAEYVRRLSSDVAGPHGMTRLTAGSLDRMPAVAGVESIDRRLEMAETMMMGLRLEEGVDSSNFGRRFGSTPYAEYTEIIGELDDLGLLDTDNGALKLTRRGRMLGNEVFSRFFED